MNQDQYEKYKNWATQKLKHAIDSGEFPKITKKTKCVDCGKPAQLYSHADYREPFNVEPVCKICVCYRPHPLPEYTKNTLPRGAFHKEKESPIQEYHTHCYIDFDEQAYELRQQFLKRIDLDMDVIIATDELRRIKKRWQSDPENPSHQKLFWQRKRLERLQESQKLMRELESQTA